MDLKLPFDALQRSEEVELLVMKGQERLYSKFRAAPYYGGIATADAIGCSFLCAYCWNYRRNQSPAEFGRFYSPEEVAETLLRISRKRLLCLFRVTGSEPILGEASFAHLIRVVEMVVSNRPGSRFVLETNGLLLGYRQDLGERLCSAPVLVRVAIKGVNPVSFEKITGARAEFFELQLEAIRKLEHLRVQVWPALMGDLFSTSEIARLRGILRERGIRAELELESLEPYPFVLENMRLRGIFWKGP